MKDTVMKEKKIALIHDSCVFLLRHFTECGICEKEQVRKDTCLRFFFCWHFNSKMSHEDRNTSVESLSFQFVQTRRRFLFEERTKIRLHLIFWIRHSFSYFVLRWLEVSSHMFYKSTWLYPFSSQIRSFLAGSILQKLGAGNSR